MHAHVHTRMHTPTHERAYTYEYACVCTHVRTCAHARVRMLTPKHAHTHECTHTCSPAVSCGFISSGCGIATDPCLRPHGSSALSASPGLHAAPAVLNSCASTPKTLSCPLLPAGASEIHSPSGGNKATNILQQPPIAPTMKTSAGVASPPPCTGLAPSPGPDSADGPMWPRPHPHRTHTSHPATDRLHVPMSPWPPWTEAL